MAGGARARMVSGEWYTFDEPELVAMRDRAAAAIHEHNMLAPAQRGNIGPALAALLGSAGSNARIEPNFHCAYAANIFLSEASYINFGCVILDQGEVRIGAHSMLGPQVQIYTVEHHRDVALRNAGHERARPVTIGDNVWIGGGAIILAGVTIGDGAIVGAGSVVTKSVPGGATVIGNPARYLASTSAQ